MGIFSTRFIKEFERLETLPESAALKAGSNAAKVDIKIAARDAEGIDQFVNKLKRGEAIDNYDQVALGNTVKSVLAGLPVNPQTGHVSLSSIRNMQRAYAHSFLVEFGEGPQAKAAIESFRSAVSDSLRGNLDSVSNKTSTVDRIVARVDARTTRDAANPDLRIHAAEVRGREDATRTQQSPTGGDPLHRNGGNEPPRSGSASNQTEAELAATARKVAEDARADLVSIYTARTDIAKGLRSITQGGFAEKKAAFFDLIDKNMDGSGYLKRATTAQEIETIAKGGTQDRDLDVVKDILLSRPGQGGDNKFMNGVITVSEWSKLRSALHGDVLVAEQKALTDNLDVVRRSLTTKLKPEDLKAAFVRLRAISDDADYQAASSASGSPKLRGPRETQEALQGGQKVAREELNGLETYYNRYHAEQPAVATEAGLISKLIGVVTGGKFGGKGGTAAAKEPSSFDRLTEWETGRRVVKPIGTGLKVAGTAAAGVTAAAALGTGIAVFADPEIEDGVTRSVGVTALSTIGGLGLPGGTSGNMYSEAIAIKAQRDPQVIKRLEKRLDKDGVLSPAVNDAITYLKENSAKRKDADAKDQASTKAILDQRATTGQREGIHAIALSSPVATDHQVRQALGNTLEAGEISPAQMRALAAKMTQISSTGVDADGKPNKPGMDAKEFEAIQREPEFKDLKPAAQRLIIDELSPRVR